MTGNRLAGSGLTVSLLRWVLRPEVLALVLVVGGFALRLPDPWGRQLEYDEVFGILFARHDFWEIVQASAADTTPPLYYWLLHAWDGAGELFSARFFSVWLGTLALPVFYALGRRLTGPGEAVAALGLLAISPIAVFYGHYTRMYALLLLCGLLTAYAFVRWLGTGQRRDLAAFTAASAVSLWVHPLAGLLLLALDVAFLWGRDLWPGSLWRRVGDLAVAHGLMALAFAPWLVYLPGQLDKVSRAFWIPVPGGGELVRTIIMWHFHLPLPDGLLIPLAFVALCVAAVTLLETVRRWRAATTAQLRGLVVLVSLALAPVGMMFLVSQVRPVYVERAVLVSCAAYLLLAVGALGRLPVRPVAWLLAGLLWAGTIAALVYQDRYDEFPRSPFRAATDTLAAELRPGDTVLHDNKLSFFPMHYFSPAMPQQFLPDISATANDTLAPATMDVLDLHPTTLEAAAATAGGGRLWYVVFDRALQQAAAAGIPHANRTWLDQHLRPERELTVGDLRLIAYAGARS